MSMYNNILIISDNPHLAYEFEKVLLNHTDQFGNYAIAISPFSPKEVFKEIRTNEIVTLDLKKDPDINFIIKHFDLVFSIHCKQIFPNKIVEKIKCINIHPGYNPINRGWFPQVFAIINDLPIGATIHEIDTQLDHGKIIDRELVPKYQWDTSLDIYKRVQNKEIELIKKNIKKILNGSYKPFNPENEGQLFLKKNFNDLLQLDLEKKATFKEFIDYMRALTHGDYKNAFFLDPESGQKIYVSIELTRENEEEY